MSWLVGWSQRVRIDEWMPCRLVVVMILSFQVSCEESVLGYCWDINARDLCVTIDFILGHVLFSSQ